MLSVDCLIMCYWYSSYDNHQDCHWALFLERKVWPNEVLKFDCCRNHTCSSFLTVASASQHCTYLEIKHRYASYHLCTAIHQLSVLKSCCALRREPLSE